MAVAAPLVGLVGDQPRRGVLEAQGVRRELFGEMRGHHGVPVRRGGHGRAVLLEVAPDARQIAVGG